MPIDDHQKKKIDDERATEAAIEEFTELSGKGDSCGWKMDRDKIHERKQVADEEVFNS